MDSEIEQHVKTFVKANVRRVQIALAICIIKSKPDGMTAVQYAARIQAHCRLKYSSTVPIYSAPSKDNIYKQKVLSLQQEQLISSVWRVIPETTTNFTTNFTSGLFASVDNVLEDDLQMDTSNEDLLTDHNEMNLQFIQAMVQLKSIANTFSQVSASELKNVLSPVIINNESNEREVSQSTASQQSITIPDYLRDQHGFGFGFQTNRDTNVSTGVLRYIIHSLNGNNLLIHSVRAVLQYLDHNITTDKLESLEMITQNWKGSVLEFSLNVVLELVDFIGNQGQKENECRELCLSFIHYKVDALLNMKGLNMHSIWSQQCYILIELGNSKFICVDFINFLMDKIKTVSDNLKPKDIVDHDPGNIEKVFYIFYMAEKLLKKWKKFQESQTSTQKSNMSTESERPQSQTSNVLDLWKRNWSGSHKSVIDVECDEPEINFAAQWKDTLEKLTINNIEDYPFITLYSFQCLEILKDM